MAQLDYSIGQARTPLNIQPGIQNYFSAQANKRANIASEATQKAAKKTKTIADMVSRNTDETGKLNRENLKRDGLKKGMLGEVTKWTSNWAKQDAAIFKAEDDKRERQGKVLGRLAEGFKFAPDDYESKERAFNDFLLGVRNAGMQIPEQLSSGIPGNAELQFMDRLFNERASNEAKKRYSEQLSPELADRKMKLATRKVDLGFKKVELGEKKLKQDLKDIAAGGITPEKKIKIEEKLRGEFIKQNLDYSKVGSAYNRVKAAGKDPSAAGDLALIFNYMKMLDPGSTVREGEFATAESSGSIPDRMTARYNKILRGERLSPPQRADFMDRSKRLMKAAGEGYDVSKSTWGKLAKSYGVDPSRVTVNLSKQRTSTLQKKKSLRAKYGY